MKYLNNISIAMTVLAVVFTSGVVIAWTGPTLTAPSGNMSTPLNVTGTSQVKAGGLWASSVGSDSGYCIDASCISVWPTPQLTTSGTSVYYNTGNVGVGTTTPGTILSIQGVANFSVATTTIYSTGGINIKSGCFAINGVCVGTDPWTKSGTAIYSNNTGNVGIGTASPMAKLDIDGFLRLAPQSSPGTCDASRKGSIAISNVNGRPCICNGSAWKFDYDGSSCVWAGTSGSQTYSSPGTYSFTVPSYATSLIVEVWGGGASGDLGMELTGTGDAGGNSSWNGGVIGGGGQPVTTSGTVGVGGIASGGDINTTGSNASNPNGGAGANGGAGGAIHGQGVAPGGGGGGNCTSSCGGWFYGGGGGGGGYAKKTYVPGALTSGSSITVVVGDGGVHPSDTAGTYAGKGANGRVLITWQ